MRSAGSRHGMVALLCAALLLPVVVFAQTSAAKVGYVDLKRLIDNAPQMLDSRAQLERQFAARDAALKTDEARLAALKLRSERESAMMTKADADALKREIETLDRSIKRTREELRNELNARAASERDRIWQQINDSVIEYAREQGYDLIVPSPVVYASSHIDITDAVLERLRRAHKGKPDAP